MSELVLVDTVVLIKHRYIIEVPDGKSEWALDTVVMEEAEEFSQKFISEDIVDHRVISKSDLRKFWEEDNFNWKEAPDDVLNAYITKIDDEGLKIS